MKASTKYTAMLSASERNTKGTRFSVSGCFARFHRPVRWALLLFLLALGIITCIPILFLVTGSFMDKNQLMNSLFPIMGNGSGFVEWGLIPDRPTLFSYALLLDTPEFFTVFWNSFRMTGGILLGQLLIGIPAAWALAKLSVPGKKIFYLLYIILMLMPFQVTMLSSYLVLDSLSLRNTTGGIVFPAVFSTFPVFIMYRFFSGIPDAVLESATLDGGGRFQICFWIGIPLGSAGIISSLILGFLEYWNMIEQPMTFLENRALWPLSLYLPNVSLEKSGYLLAASVVTMLPPILLFFSGQDYLERGIIASAVKE